MRTTLSLDDDVFRVVKLYAEERSVSVGKAVSLLVRRGLAARRPVRETNGLAIFDLPPDSPRVTSREVRDLEAEQE